MSDIPMREMDLSEILGALPLGHKARLDYGRLTARLSSEKDKTYSMKTVIEKSRAYLDSFIETEGSKDHYIVSTGEYENCQIDFSEAQKALDLLGCDDGHGFDNAL